MINRPQDYISREAAIIITEETGALETQRRIYELPAAEVRENKITRWVTKDISGEEIPDPYCSVCGWVIGKRESRYYKFCPHCGRQIEEISEH